MGGAVPAVGANQRRVVLDRTLVGEPQQRATIVAERVGHVTLRRLGPQRHRTHPRWGVPGNVLLHERCLTADHPDHRQRAAVQHRDDPVTDRVQVVHQIPLGCLGPVEQRLVEVGQGHPVPHLIAAHRITFPSSGCEVNSAYLAHVETSCLARNRCSRGEREKAIQH